MKSVVLGSLSAAVIGSAQAMVSCPMPPDPLVQMKYVSFFDGDPAQMIELAPDEASADGKLDLTWQFGVRSREGVTMVCSYSNSDKQNAPLPESVSVCKLTGAIDADGNVSGAPTLICQ